MAAKKSAKDKDQSTSERNITLITNGTRIRSRQAGDAPVAEITTKFSSQEELHKLWEKEVNGIPEKSYVIGAGPHGIFSESFAAQVTQLADLENVWCPSTGLGMVNLGAKYPQYDLGEFDADIRRALPREINDKMWWDFVCGLSGNSLASVITAAVQASHRVVVAIPGMQFFQYKPDLIRLLNTTGTDGLDKLRRQLRFVGPDLDIVLPPQLLPCAMPYDKEAVDRLVPGARVNGTRRTAALLLDVVKTPENGGTDPRKDYEAMLGAFSDEEREPLEYKGQASGARGTAVRLSDEEALERIGDYEKMVGTAPVRIMRMMRADGYNINAERVEALISQRDKAAMRATAAGKKGKARA